LVNPYKVWIIVQLDFLALAASTDPASLHLQSRFWIRSSLLGLNFEIWSRRWSILPAFFVLGLFSIGTATSKNATSIFLARVFTGLFGSATVSNVSAA
jgi:hypothetical protein